MYAVTSPSNNFAITWINKIVDILTLFVSNFSRFKDILDLEYRVLYFSIMEKTHIETNIMGKMGASYICNHTIICHCGSPRLPPAVCLVKGLADKHCDCSLAFHRDFPCKIKFVCGGSGKRKICTVWTAVSCQWFLYTGCHWHYAVIYFTVFGFNTACALTNSTLSRQVCTSWSSSHAQSTQQH